MTTYSLALHLLDEAAPSIQSVFKAIGPAWHTPTGIRNLFNRNRAGWNLSSLSNQDFLAYLLEKDVLRKAVLKFRSRSLTRYAWADPPVYALAQSIDPVGYFSHYTAIDLHGLTREVPKTIYFNIEQAKAPGAGSLTQAAIDRAFSPKAKQRLTTNIAMHNDLRICILEGGNTGSLGVIDLEMPNVSKGRITNLERTLIDAAVRPAYCGGVSEVVKTYRIAREKAPSVNKIASYLKQIGYTYPYHQAIGFYLELADFPDSQLRLIERIGITFDFYLDYGLKEKEYDSRWRIHYPKGTK